MLFGPILKIELEIPTSLPSSDTIPYWFNLVTRYSITSLLSLLHIII